MIEIIGTAALLVSTDTFCRYKREVVSLLQESSSVIPQIQLILSIHGFLLYIAPEPESLF